MSDEDLILDVGDFKERYLVCDEMMASGDCCPENSIHFIKKVQLKLDEVEAIVDAELKNHAFDEAPIFLVSAGSQYISAEENGWTPENIKHRSSELINIARQTYKEIFKSLEKFVKERECVIVFCQLLPLPSEQDGDDVAGEEVFLKDVVSRLFVDVNKMIEKFNTDQHMITPVVSSVLDKGKKHGSYPSKQLRIKHKMYSDVVNNVVSEKAKQLMMNSAIRYLQTN